MDTKDYLEQKIAILDEQIKVYRIKLDLYDDLHKGTLVRSFRSTGQAYYYLQHYDENGKKKMEYIGKDGCELVNRYKAKRFFEETLGRLEHNRKIFQMAAGGLVDCSLEAIREDLPKAYKELPAECFVDYRQEEFFRQTDEYPRNPLRNDNPNIASDGTKTRSKGELIIYDDLRYSTLHGKYDVKIRRCGISGAYHNLYPDFLFKGQDGREIAWEHLGMTDTNDYANRLRDKIAEYLDCGFIVGDNLFFTSDSLSHTTDEVMIIDMIDTMKRKVYGDDKNVSVGCLYTSNAIMCIYSTDRMFNSDPENNSQRIDQRMEQRYGPHDSEQLHAPKLHAPS